MRVVYTTQHMAHDVASETIMGLPVPANEVAERAERIRAALEADGGFTSVRPSARTRAPGFAGPRGASSTRSRSPASRRRARRPDGAADRRRGTMP